MGIDPALPPGCLRFDLCLFLDFDGVLHPESCDRDMRFCFMPEFCGVMREIDPLGYVPIVISSMWRFDDSIASLRSHFPPDIARQVVGVTPDLEDQGAWAMRGAWEMEGGKPYRMGLRQRECMAWMREYAPAGEWLAIDDRASYFSDDCQNLFLVPGFHRDEGNGLNSVVADSLRERLQEFLGSEPKSKPEPGVLS